jgi:peptidyl-prolyl cis-trans isomerase SurA
MDLIIKSNNLPNTDQTLMVVKKQVLQMLIDEKLFENESKRLKISIDEYDISHALNIIAANNNLKPNQLDKFLHDIGISKDELKNQIKHQLQWSKIIQTQIEPLVVVTEQDLKNCKLISKPDQTLLEDHVKLAEITIYPNKKNAKEVELLLKQLMQQINNGGDFEKLARDFSQSSTSKSGGEIGWFYVSQLSKEFADAVINLQPGHVSNPIVTGDSIHLVKVLERKSANIEKAKNPIQEMVDEKEVKESLRQRKLDIQVKAYLLKLRKHAFIDLKIKN